MGQFKKLMSCAAQMPLVNIDKYTIILKGFQRTIKRVDLVCSKLTDALTGRLTDVREMM